MRPRAEIRVRHLTKSFSDRRVLQDVSLDIPEGQCTVVLGPSGTGKSVFLKSVLGLLTPDSGEIWVDDDNVPALRHKQLLAVRKKFGVLFQDGALFGSMSVYDNTAFPCASTPGSASPRSARSSWTSWTWSVWPTPPSCSPARSRGA